MSTHPAPAAAEPSSDLFSPSVSQWDCIRPNRGEWHGQFTQFSPVGEWLSTTPSLLTLHEERPDEQMRLTLVRTPTVGPQKTNTLQFSAPGPAPHVVFFPSGAFSQGPLQRRKWADFGAELALNAGHQRLRSVQLYDGDLSGTSTLKYVTVITECRDPEALPPARPKAPTLTLSDLAGEWHGDVLFQAADMTPPVKGHSTFQLQPRGQHWHSQSHIVTATGETLLSDTQPMAQASPGHLHSAHQQHLLLPGKALCTLPPVIPESLTADRSFTLELAWYLTSHMRQRLIRQYDAKGNWVGLFFAVEFRQS